MMNLHRIFLVLLTLSSISVSSFAQALSPQAIDRVKAFAKVYGYVRWFHPSDEAQEINWNKFAAYGVKQVLKTDSEEELASTLSDLFRPFAPSVIIYPENRSIRFAPSLLIPQGKDNLVPISWIHYGLESNPNSQFKSFRTHRVQTVKEMEKPFGNLTYSIPADSLKGKQIRLKASLKMDEESEGTGHLWLRVDLENGEMGFLENSDKSPVRSTVWTTREMSCRVSERARSIAFGAFLNGSGGLGLDGFQLEIKEGETWHAISIDNPGFEEAYMGNWKFQGREHKMTFPDSGAAAGASYLHIATRVRQKTIPKSVEEGLEFGTFIDKPIGASLKALVPLVLMGDADHTYPVGDAQALETLNKTLEKNFSGFQWTDSLHCRLATVLVAWNGLQHFYPYLKAVDKDWDEQLERGLMAASEPASRTDLRQILESFIAPAKDGHAFVFHPYDRSANYLPPIGWRFLDKKLVITHVFSPELSVRVGDEVLSIDGNAPSKVAEAQAGFISASTESHFQFRLAHQMLKGPQKTSLTIKVQHAGGEKETVELRRTINQGIYNQQFYENAGKPVREVAKNAIYVDLTQIEWRDLEPRLEEIANYDHVILDLRGYPKNNHFILSHLLTQPDTAAHWMRVPGYEYPDQERVRKAQFQGWNLNPQPPRIDSRVIFLADARTISYGESMLGLARHYQLGKIVGEPTAGINGQVNDLVLPGGFRMGYTGMEVTLPSGEQHFGVGFQPDILVSPTLKGIQEGKDEILEAAIRSLTE